MVVFSKYALVLPASVLLADAYRQRQSRLEISLEPRDTMLRRNGARSWRDSHSVAPMQASGHASEDFEPFLTGDPFELLPTFGAANNSDDFFSGGSSIPKFDGHGQKLDEFVDEVADDPTTKTSPPAKEALTGAKLPTFTSVGEPRKNDPSRPVVKDFQDDLWKSFVEATKPKAKKATSNTNKGKVTLKCPLSQETYNALSFWERNPYFMKKLQEFQGDWYKAMEATIANVCADEEEPAVRDECTGIFEFLRTLDGDENKKAEIPRWKSTFVDMADGIRAMREQFELASKYDKPCEAAAALADMWDTHSQTLKVHASAEKFLDAARKAQKKWKEFIAEFDKVLSDVALQQTFIANCRVMPSMLGMESQVSPLDCEERLEKTIKSRQFIQARCVALGGTHVWENYAIGTNASLDDDLFIKDPCKKVYDAPWNEDGLKPTQEGLACSRIFPFSLYDSKVALPLVDGPHYPFMLELGSTRKFFLFAEPTDAEKPTQVNSFINVTHNSFADEEDNVRTQWPELLSAEKTLNNKCQSAGGVSEKIPATCTASKEAMEKLRREASQLTGSSEADLSDPTSTLFGNEKQAAQTVLQRILKAYRSEEEVFAYAAKELKEGRDPSKPPERKKEEPEPAKPAATEGINTGAPKGKSKGKGKTIPPLPKGGGKNGKAASTGEAKEDDVKEDGGTASYAEAAQTAPKGKGKAGPPGPPPVAKGGGKAPGKGGPPPPKGGGKAPGKGGPPPPKGGGKGGPPPPKGKGKGAGTGGGVPLNRDFKPTSLPDGQTVSVWTWLEKGVKLWRVIFDDSTKAKLSLVRVWSDTMNKYDKCAFMTRCFEYPNVMLSIDLNNRKEEAAKKKSFLKNKCIEYCREVQVRVVDCTDPKENRACAKPLLIKEGFASLQDVPETSTVWCDKQPKALRKSLEYAAIDAVKQANKKITSHKGLYLADMVRVVDFPVGDPVPLTDSDISALWSLTADQVGEVFVRIEKTWAAIARS